jgi:hypothetical protein
MYQRTLDKSKLTFSDGNKFNMVILDGLTIEDVLGQHMDAYLYGLSVGTYVAADIGRDVKDYLIKLYTIT